MGDGDEARGEASLLVNLRVCLYSKRTCSWLLAVSRSRAFSGDFKIRDVYRRAAG
jgi:hypothetical protein